MSQTRTEYARRVKVRVTIGGHDATSRMEPYLLDFAYTDNVTGKADEIQISLHDRDGKWNNQWKPKKGMEVTASIECRDWFAPGENASLPCGAFRIDELEFSGPPDKVTVKAVTSALTTGLRDTAHTRAWENTSLKVVAGQIAAEHGLELLYEGEAHEFERRDQRDESDLTFVDRMAAELGMYCKAHDGRLILLDRRETKQKSASTTLTRAGGAFAVKRYSFKQASSKTEYTAASVAYTDPSEGRTHTAVVESGDAAGQPDEKMLALNRRVEAAGEAMKLADSALDGENEKKDTASVELMGHPGLVAGMTVELAGFGDFSGKYLIKKAEHKVGNGGYTTSLELAGGSLAPDRRVTAGSAELTARPGAAPGNGNAGVNATDRWERNFTVWRKFWELLGVDEMTKLLLCLPDIADAMAGRQTNASDARGWLYLRSMFHHWFSGKGSTASGAADPFWVDWDWVMSYARARGKYDLFTQHRPEPATEVGPNIKNDAALASLGRILCRDGYMIDVENPFDFAALPWTEWQKAYHTQISVPRVVPPDGLTPAMGAFTLRALARGLTKPNGKGGHTVHVAGMAVFVHDVFNFEEEGIDWTNWLGRWDCATLSAYAPGGTDLYNNTFRNFRDASGHGDDFLVLSMPHTVENFSGIRYAYTCVE